MSLHRATPAAPLPAGPPYACVELEAWRALEPEFPPGDPRLAELHRGAPERCPAHANLAGAVAAWRDAPASMDFLDPASPNHECKLLERGLYLDRWLPWLPPGARVLDVGGGIGRFAAWLLDRGCDVDLVDPDLRALRRALDHAIGRPGRLDLHWSTAEALPELGLFDVVLAVEVLCYCENPALALANLRRALRPGGTLLFSVEAPYGWSMSIDVPAGTLPALLGDGVVHVPGDRFVRTFDEASIRATFAGWEILDLLPTHYLLSGPLEGCAGPVDLPGLIEAEARIRAHPVLGRLNRAWMGVARPG